MLSILSPMSAMKTFGGQGFEVRDALNDPELTEFYCPTCGGRVVCGNFLRQNFEKYICIGKCENLALL